MFKSSKSVLITSVLVLTALLVTGYGCEKQAKSGDKALKTSSKTCMAGKVADANAAKASPMKDKKACHAKAEKKCSDEMAKKCAADPNTMKNCPMKDKKGCPMMKTKKACPKDCKKPCCAKKTTGCKAADANAPAKQ